MSVASIVCVDGELDVHDTASRAVTAAIERRRELPEARIGICAGDLELGDPLGLAKRLCELAQPGAILMSDTIRRSIERDQRAAVALGAVSIGGYRDRVHVFELDGHAKRERTVLSVELITTNRISYVGREAEELAELDAQLTHYERSLWSTVLAHRGFICRVVAMEHWIAFADPADALRAAIALDALPIEAFGRLRIGIERGEVTYLTDRWFGGAWNTAARIRSQRYRQLAATMTVVEGIGHPALRDLGLIIEVVEEVVQKGIRDPVRVAHLRIALP